MNLHSIVSRNNDLMSAPVDREIVFLNEANDSYVALDYVGRRIWELLDRPRQVSDVVDRLCEEFDGPREAIDADVREFLEELGREGIVRVSDRGAGAV